MNTILRYMTERSKLTRFDLLCMLIFVAYAGEDRTMTQYITAMFVLLLCFVLGTIVEHRYHPDQ